MALLPSLGDVDHDGERLNLDSGRSSIDAGERVDRKHACLRGKEVSVCTCRSEELHTLASRF